VPLVEKNQSPQGEKTILVVDDNPDIRHTLARLLGAFGLHAATAPDGRSALEYLRDHPSSVGLILLDLMMPVMDGWEFRDEQLRDDRLASIPVVVCSGAGTVEGRHAFDGVLGVHRKPVDPLLLLTLARDCCSSMT
jgi:CheY-like chemotaxis protein